MDPEEDQLASPAGAEEQGVTDSAAAPAATDDTPDSSPAGQQHAEEESLSDVIRKAANGSDEEDEDAPADDPDEDAADEGGESKRKTDADGDPTKQDAGQETEEEDEGEDLKEGQRVPYDRFQKVIHQRNEYRRERETLREEVTRYKQGHENFTALQGFMQENDLRQQDVVEALQIAAAFNRDPARAAQLLAPKLDALQRATGERLPEDLQGRVDRGEISEESAREIVRTRAENARLQRENERTRQQQSQRDQAQQLHDLRQSMATAANEAQNEIAQADPDYAKKEPLVRKELELLIHKKPPRTPEDATALVREAHQNVTRELTRIVGRKEVRPGPKSDSGGRTDTAAHEPETMLDAIRQAANQSG